MERVPFLPRTELDDRLVAQILDKTIEDLAAEHLAGHFASAEEDGGLDLVAVVEEAQHVVLLGLVIVLVDVDPELDFLDRDDVLVLLRLALLLFLLIKEFAEVHDTDHGGLRGGRDFDQVKGLFAGHLESFVGLHDADLVTFVVDHTHFAGANAVIGANKLLIDAKPPALNARQIITSGPSTKYHVLREDMNLINVEIKAKCADAGRVREILKQRQAHFAGTDHQIDTYFHVPAGRLKLRQGTIENSLIAYRRPDQSGPKTSDVVLAGVTNGDDLRGVLERALGVLVAVDKQREIYFVGNVKFHIDQVEGLGGFVEIEACGKRAEEAKLQAQCREYMELFGIREEQLVTRSYSDLLMEK